MNFEQALKILRDEGRPVRRQCWSDPGMVIGYMPPTVVPADKVSERTLRFWPKGQDLNLAGYCVKIHKRVWSPGWRPSPEDMEADDWQECGPGESEQPKAPACEDQDSAPNARWTVAQNGDLHEVFEGEQLIGSFTHAKHANTVASMVNMLIDGGCVDMQGDADAAFGYLGALLGRVMDEDEDIRAAIWQELSKQAIAKYNTLLEQHTLVEQELAFWHRHKGLIQKIKDAMELQDAQFELPKPYHRSPPSRKRRSVRSKPKDKARKGEDGSC